MPKPFHQLTLDEFTDLLGQFTFTRRIESVHMHHTWRPNHADFASRAPIQSIEGMFNHHTQVNRWSDIAQHVTIDPTGTIWTGRDWNSAPASATGFNGNSGAGPFMFEMIGDFDQGRDKFDGEQRTTTIGVVAALLRRFNLGGDAVKFHNQMSTKTCPGSAIDREAFLDAVRAVLGHTDVERTIGGTSSSGINAFDDSTGLIRQRSLTIIANWEAATRTSISRIDEQELGEDLVDSNEVAVITGLQVPAAITDRGIFGGGQGFTPEELQLLRRHVINLRLGAFSDGGEFETTTADVKRIFEELIPEALESQKARGEPLRLLFFAHGGLVSEDAGIRPCLTRIPFWVANNVYPIFFAWETGLGETVADIVQSLFKGERGFVSDAADALIEFAASQPGREIWSRMKRSAELASLASGGANIVAERTSELWNENHTNMEIHAIGHSAGSIFLSHFLPTLLEKKTATGIPPIAVKTLHFLAPACTTDLFKTTLKDRIGPDKQILSHTMYTMNKDLEQADKAGPYQKSLLYLVSRAFEPVRPTPILGLEESLRDDPTLVRFYGLSRTVTGVAQILFSQTPADAALNSATRSTRHGDFDDDVPTMNSVVRRILKRQTGAIVSFPERRADNEVTRGLALRTAVPPTELPTAILTREDLMLAQNTRGELRALCIGIDAYPAPNTLAGCVNDARAWAAKLTELGFKTELLLDGQATRTNILSALQRLIAQSRAGDVAVFQYSGHGTQVQDLDGDETDGQDEALVPVDFGNGSFVIDDDLRAVMQAIPAGVNVTCFMDCCHSGTNTRLFAPPPATDAGGSRPRFMRISGELNARHVARRRQMRDASPPLRDASTMREVNFAACRPDQVAFESQGAGDFTRRAIPILNSAHALTNEEFQKHVVAAFSPSARQEPVLDCAPDIRSRPLFNAMPLALVASAAAGVGGFGLEQIVTRLNNIERRVGVLER